MTGLSFDAGAGAYDRVMSRWSRDYWSPFEAGGGRGGQLYQGLPETARGAVRREIRERITQFESGGRLVVPAESLFGIARV